VNQRRRIDRIRIAATDTTREPAKLIVQPRVHATKRFGVPFTGRTEEGRQLTRSKITHIRGQEVAAGQECWLVDP
jgi:hypothetical protein